MISLMGWKGYALAVGVGVVIGVIPTRLYYLTEIAEVKAAHATHNEKQASAALAAVEEARGEERRRTAVVEKARDDAQGKILVAVADANSVRIELGWMRKHARSLADAAIDRDPFAADGSPAGVSAVDLLAYMLGRVSDRAAELAAVADRARIAGLTCEAAYDGLTK